MVVTKNQGKIISVRGQVAEVEFGGERPDAGDISNRWSRFASILIFKSGNVLLSSVAGRKS